MEKSLFEDLLQSLKEASAIAKGELEAPRRFKFVSIDVRAYREKLGVTQDELAALLQVDLSTLSLWEEHHCMREEYAALLNEMPEAHGEAVPASRQHG